MSLIDTLHIQICVGNVNPTTMTQNNKWQKTTAIIIKKLSIGTNDEIQTVIRKISHIIIDPNLARSLADDYTLHGYHHEDLNTIFWIPTTRFAPGPLKKVVSSLFFFVVDKTFIFPKTPCVTPVWDTIRKFVEISHIRWVHRQIVLRIVMFFSSDSLLKRYTALVLHYNTFADIWNKYKLIFFL